MARPIPPSLLDQLIYKDGEVFYKFTTSGRYRNDNKAGHKTKGGYTRIKYKNVRYQMNRVVWALHYGDPGNFQVDHIDQNKENDKIENLRLATPQQNQFNRKAKNIYWCTQTKSWAVCFTIMGKPLFKKRFKCFGEAFLYARATREKLHMEFTNHRTS